MKNLTISLLLLTYSLCHAEIVEIYNTQTATVIEMNTLLSQTPATGYFVLGEFHNTEEIQKAQAHLISLKTKASKEKGNFSVFWEFLNYTDQENTNNYYKEFTKGRITAKEFLTNTAGAQNLSYAPIMEETKLNNGFLKGVNLPRKIKQKIIKDGIQTIDPKYIPRNHYVGGPNYKKRFELAMGGHAPQDVIEKYFLVQCLTDSVMAEQIILSKKTPLNYIIAGSFHTDFYDATVIRLKKLINENIITFKFLSLTDQTLEEINDFKNGDKTFGHYADYLIITK
jgi:uncharacterized iron-regulated protein